MTTPVRRQYLNVKREHRDEILLFRMGDFYETFDDDARLLSRELEIALTSREFGKGQRVPLAGIPYHSLESSLARLIRKGYRVAICEQVSDPATSKGIVDREVVRVVTPGTIIEDALLEQKANNYLAALVVEADAVGLAWVDITTSEFATTQFAFSNLAVELARLMPSELLVPEGQDDADLDEGVMLTPLTADAFHADWARETLLRHFGVASLESFGCEGQPLAVRAAGAVIDYLQDTQRGAVGQITTLYTYSTADYMVLDPQTRRNLELYEGGRWGMANASLLSVLDVTKTSMGGRLLRRWLGQPLLDVERLMRRQDAVEWFHRSALRRERVVMLLEAVSDMERLVNRVRGHNATPRDLVSLANSLEAAPKIKAILCEDDDAAKVDWIAERIADNAEVVELVRQAIADDPPLSVGDGNVIRQGFSPDLDEVRGASRNAQDYIARLEKKERERTGIKSLKVGYNRVFGYYIEISNSNLDLAPDDYVRRQTLVGGERFITPEMKEYESLILNAQDRIGELEGALFRQVCQQVAGYAEPILRTARAIANIDVFASLAEVASRYGYVRPALDENDTVQIKQGRHPVVERMLPPGDFVANDTELSSGDEQLIILTGPNMAGKSTYIRQVAVIVLMAQVGSFVPAESARIGICDRIFTRVGLQDDLAMGQSTFMVEMVETAAILNHATPRSLIVLDEIGRGTSTYDGLALARAVAEHIHNNPRLGCKTLFATHYHELTQLADTLPRAFNYNVVVTEDKGQVVFLRNIAPGGADRSYGVHVARLAGMPGSVVSRAWEVLAELEDGSHSKSGPSRRVGRNPTPQQIPLLGFGSPVVDELLALDVASMTPLDAINRLYELQERARDQK